MSIKELSKLSHVMSCLRWLYEDVYKYLYSNRNPKTVDGISRASPIGPKTVELYYFCCKKNVLLLCCYKIAENKQENNWLAAQRAKIAEKVHKPLLSNQTYLVMLRPTQLTQTQLTQASFLQKKSNVAKCFFKIWNGTVVSKIMKSGHSKSIFYVKKR